MCSLSLSPSLSLSWLGFTKIVREIEFEGGCSENNGEFNDHGKRSVEFTTMRRNGNEDKSNKFFLSIEIEIFSKDTIGKTMKNFLPN